MKRTNISPEVLEGIKNLRHAFHNFGVVTSKEAAYRLQNLNKVLDKLEETNPKFKAIMDVMRYKSLPWHKKLRIKIRKVIRL